MYRCINMCTLCYYFDDLNWFSSYVKKNTLANIYRSIFFESTNSSLKKGMIEPFEYTYEKHVLYSFFPFLKSLASDL